MLASQADKLAKLQQQGRQLQDSLAAICTKVTFSHTTALLIADGCLCTVHCRRDWHLRLIGQPLLHSHSSKIGNCSSQQQQDRQLQQSAAAICTKVTFLQTSALPTANDCLCTVHCRRGWHLRLIGLQSYSSKAGSCRRHWLQLTLRTTKSYDTLWLLLRKRCAMFPASFSSTFCFTVLDPTHACKAGISANTAG